MIDATPIFKAIIALLAAVITAVVVPYIRSRTSIQQQAAIDNWVHIAVEAAEQIYIGPGRGLEKKQYVVDWLMAHGVKLDMAKLDAMIESAVYAMKHGALLEVAHE